MIIKEQKAGIPTILIANDKQILISMPQSAIIGGVKTNEVTLSSTMIRAGRAIMMYGYVPQSESELAVDFLKGLQTAASTLMVQ